MPSDLVASTWDAYRDWASFAREQKSSLTRWQRVVLVLAIGGALSETYAASGLPQAIVGEDLNLVAGLGFVVLAAAAFLGRNQLGGRPERVWVGARSLAESLKSEVYKYCARVPPYQEDDRARQLAARIEQIAKPAVTLGMIPDPAKRARRDPPTEPMTTDEYIRDRLESQIHLERGYYWSAARENLEKTKRFQRTALALGLASAIFGGLGTLGIGGLAIWVAVLTTVSSALAASFHAGRFDYLALTYSATARRLQHLVDTWHADPAPDNASNFVSRCEEAMGAENQAWMAEWLRDDAPPLSPQIPPKTS